MSVTHSKYASTRIKPAERRATIIAWVQKQSELFTCEEMRARFGLLGPHARSLMTEFLALGVVVKDRLPTTGRRELPNTLLKCQCPTVTEPRSLTND